MSCRIEDARGIVLADVGRESAAIAAQIYAHHSAGTEVFPVRLSPAPPTGDCGGVVVDATAVAGYPRAEFAGKTHIDAAADHVKTGTAKACFIFEAAHHLSSYKFQRAIEVIRKFSGHSFVSGVRIMVLFDGRGPLPISPFTEARCFAATWFGSRTVLGTVTGIPDREADPRTGEVVARCYSPHGIDPCDTFVAGFVAAVSGRTPDADTLRGGAVLIAATARGQAGALCRAAEIAFGWNPDDALVAESVYYGNDGTESRRKVRFPISSASRKSERYFAAILEVAADEVAAKVASTGKPTALGRGTWLEWDGETVGDIILDESTVDPDGFHCREPETAADPDNPVLRCRLYPTAREVEVPLYAMSNTRMGLSVRVCGFGPGGDAAPFITGATATSAALERDAAGRTPVMVAEPFSQDEFRAGLSAVVGAKTVYGLAPGPRGSLVIKHPPPFGSGPPPTDPRAFPDRVARMARQARVYTTGIAPA